MMNFPSTPYGYPLSLPLAERVPAGGMIWLMGRLLLGALFVMTGAQKLMGLDAFAAELIHNGIPASYTPVLAPLGAGVEFLGGFCIAFGIATNLSSLVMIAFVIVATLIAHRFWQASGDAVEMQKTQFTKNLMIIGAFCMLYVAGGGPYSIDRALRERHRARD